MMRATLLKLEKEVLEEGREWTRKRLEERLQQCADQIPAVCEQSGLVLKRQQPASFTLMTVSGTVTIAAIRGYSKATGSWHCPVREQWGLAKWARLSPEFEQRLVYNAAASGSFQKAGPPRWRWVGGKTIRDGRGREFGRMAVTWRKTEFSLGKGPTTRGWRSNSRSRWDFRR